LQINAGIVLMKKLWVTSASGWGIPPTLRRKLPPSHTVINIVDIVRVIHAFQVLISAPGLLLGSRHRRVTYITPILGI